MTDGGDRTRDFVAFLIKGGLGFVAGCFLLVGLPIAIYHGLTTEDWVWLLAWLIGLAVIWLLGKLGWIVSIND